MGGFLYMALIKCPECNRDVSENAEICPNCGLSIKEYQKSKEKANEIKLAKERLIAEMNKKLEEIDSLPFPDKPTYFDIIKSDNNWLIFISLFTFILSLIIFFSSLIAFGKFDGLSAAFAVLSIIVTLVFYYGINNVYKEKLSIYNNFEKYKTTEKKRIKENYEYSIESIIEKYGREKNVNEKFVSYVGLKCPVCGSLSVKRISTVSRLTSVAMVGIASSKIGKQYQCNNCKHKW